jgi:ParB family chromosome partitioning protein
MLRNKKSTDGPARKRLGRGLESLISKPVPIDVSKEGGTTSESGHSRASAPASKVEHQISGPSGASSAASLDGTSIVSITLDAISPNRRQPRQSIDEAALESLAQSIHQAGLMQPIVVRIDAADRNRYELVAGERRWRAARKLGLPTIPAIVRDLDERAAAELALIENIQREDLNPIDRAEAFERLLTDFDLTHQELAERVGLDRSTITNFTRLVALDEFTREMVRSGKLSLGHAKVLLAITNDKVRSDLAGRAVKQGLSVRALEREVELLRSAASSAGAATAIRSKPAHLVDLERQLAQHLGTKVRIRAGAKKGTGSITIDFYSLAEFEGITHRLGFASDGAAV